MPASDALQPIKDALTGIIVKGIESSWEPLLDRLEAFTKMMDAITEVHPYAKMAWSVLSAAYKRDRDTKIQKLVQKMQDVYEFLCDAQDLQNEKSREGVLSRLAMQTVECGHFISTYARNPSFLRRVLQQSASSMTAKIGEYSGSFDDLLEEFCTGSQLRIEIATVRMLANIKDLSDDMDIRDIPYADGAGYEIGKRCLAGTRDLLLDEITEWASVDALDTPRIYILMGPAGTGKSTIAHTIASRFDKLKQIGSVFCFSTSEAATRTPESLFRNMARDLCDGRPAFKAALSKSVGGSKARCSTKDIETQFDTFVLGPARMLSVSGTIVIIIDALDESGTVEARAKIIRMIAQRFRDLPSSFRFLITARAEQDIQESFPESSTETIVKRMPTLADDVQLSGDILHYIRYTLTDVHGNLPRGLSEESCTTLSAKAEGLFQWAAVACSYIKGPRVRQSPSDRYLVVTRRGDTSLDGLYNDVLSQIFDQDPDALESFRSIMGIALTAVEPLCMRSLDALMTCLRPEELLDVHAFLPFLGSLMSGVGEQTAPVRPLHSSFAQLLRSPERGKLYYIGAAGHHERLLLASLRMLKTQLHFNMSEMKTSYKLNRDDEPLKTSSNRIPEHLSYACRQWGYHLSVCPDGLPHWVPDLIHHFFTETFLFWLDAASTAGAVSSTLPCLMYAKNRLQLLHLATDSIKFVRAFARPIVDSAPHIYVSTLTSAPFKSEIFEIYQPRYARTAQVCSSRATRWPTAEIIISGFYSPFTAVAFSPDGKRIVSGSHDRTVRIWDADTGLAIGDPLIGHKDNIYCVAFSRDGNRIVSGSKDNTIIIWNVHTGKAIGDPLVGHTNGVSSIAFSPDGMQFASSSDDWTIRFWDLATGQSIGMPLTGHRADVYSVAFSPDGSTLVSGSRDKMIRLWDLNTRQAIGDPLTGHSDVVTSVAFSPDGKLFASGSYDATIRIWDTASKRIIGSPITEHKGTVRSIAFSPDGKRLATGSWDKTIRVWNVDTRKRIGEPLDGHEYLINTIAFSPDGTRIASASWDKTLRIWDATPTQTVNAPLPSYDQPFTSVAFSPNGDRIVSASTTKTVQIWDVRTGCAVCEPMQGHEGRVTSVTYAPNGRQIASGSYDKTIRLWDADKGHQVGEPLFGHQHEVYCLAFSPDGKRLVSGSKDKSIRLWDTESRHALGEPLLGHSDSVVSVVFSPDGARVVSGSRDKTIRIWDTDTGHISRLLEGHQDVVTGIAVSPDGRRIASCSNDGMVRIWDMVTGKSIGKPLEGHTTAVTCIAFSPNSRIVASGSWDKTIILWDAVDMYPICEPLAGHDHWITSVAFSPDGRSIATSSWDSTLRIWDAEMRAPFGVHMTGDSDVEGQSLHPSLEETLTLTLDSRIGLDGRSAWSCSWSVVISRT
ncbi:WD40 repeat-like protein [Calocera cornea HHB12733]|uniref:WD40 repeat-like protein n=1 Tax=Calocera cornea HHB12733 TaxID=1353952 RepID=A0A165E6B4_9BASI|nr:WD40 repeat-like protein [Calocera cornea HHB12733]